MADVSQVERQIYILSLLSQNRRGYTIEDIMNSLNNVGIDVSRKTIERDIDYITANFFVYEEEKNHRTYYYANKYSVENINFTIMELISLHFTREMLKAYSHIDAGATALGLIDRIISSTPQVNRAYVDTLSDAFKVNNSVNYHEKNINPEYLNTIRDAISSKEIIYVEYYSFNSNEVTEREFDPYFIEVQEGCYHLIGYCHLRNEIRDLRVSRIKNLKKMNKKFIRPENFYEKYKQTRFDKLSGNNKTILKLRFKEEAARFVKEYEVDKADVIENCENGEIIFKRETAMTPEIIKWILGFGSQVEVIEPSELKGKIVEEAKGIINNYAIQNDSNIK